MATTETTAPAATGTSSSGRGRRSAGLVGNRLAFVGAVLYLCEFVGIIASHVSTMPAVPGASLHAVVSTYAGQAGATGFLAGWFSLVLPGRVLFVLGVRRAVLDSEATAPSGRRTSRTLLDWAVVLMAVGVVTEVVSGAVLAGAAASATRGDGTVAFALDRVAHYLQVAIYCPSGVAVLILAVTMWRSGVFPRILAGVTVALGALQAVNGAVLSAPSTASLQDGLTVFNLLSMVAIVWIGVLLLVRTRSSAPASIE
jgi:hypothetical protein